jgi:cytochrome c oxidase cbb3-type subunit 3
VRDDFRAKYEDKLKGMTPAAILADKEMSEYVSRSGKVLFSDNCAGCHGQNGVGSVQSGEKFAAHERGLMAPVLNDDDWLYGGSVDTIHESIAAGRQGMMMAHKDMLSAAEIDTLANAVVSGNPASTPLFAEKGCTACHGADGKGMPAMGSANLTDKIWRFDSSVEGIKHTIQYGVNSGDSMSRIAVMPSFRDAGKLSETELKKLAVYVYQFGGGVADAPAAK